MDTNNKSFFWGILLGAVAAALAGAMALTRSFRTSRDGGRTWADPPKRGRGPARRPAGKRARAGSSGRGA